MKSQLGIGLIELSVALLLVSIASIGLTRSQLFVIALGEEARRHAAAVMLLDEWLALARGQVDGGRPPSGQGALICSREALSSLQIAVQWSTGLSTDGALSVCGAPPPDGWQQLALVTTVGENG